MSEDSRHIDLIEQYLNGELKGEELTAFKRRLDTDLDFAQEVEMHQALIDGIEHARREELRAFIKQNAKVRSGLGINTRWVAAVAAMAVFAVGAYLVLNINDTNVKQNELADKSEDTVSSQEIFEEKPIDELEKLKEVPVPEKKAPPPQIEIVEDDAVEFEEDYEMPVAAPEMDLIDEEVKSFEDYEEYDGEELRPELISKDRIERSDNISSKPLTIDDDIKVAKDIKTFDTTVVMHQFSYQLNGAVSSPPNYTSAPAYTFNHDLKFYSDSFKLEEVEITENKTKKKNLTASRAVLDTASTDKKELKTVTKETIAVQIEFWKSPINYKGYRFNTKNLMLYGVDKQTKVYIYKLEGKWYMKMGELYYQLITDNQFHTYKVLEDESIIIQLGE